MSIDLTTLLRAYAAGHFPMADDRDARSLYWVKPNERAILPLDGFHASRSLRKTVRTERFEVTVDTAFAQVLATCAQSAADRPETWINQDIEMAFNRLHRRGLAHSVECWAGEGAARTLVGGLYGLALGRAFFGESMFSRATDASKVAMAWLVARLRVGGFTLLDCQFMTPHLASLGAVEVSAEAYSLLLGAALDDGTGALSGDFGALDALAAGGPAADAFSAASGEGASDDSAVRLVRSAERTVSGPVSGQLIAQLITQTS
ncbi:MAG TPA: leucyl/phenylalanyl-tRNA--protein transferase [Sphingobium sp.]|nr:leucyl/phenylalanyl-tRNA--protein transferase [Sphingobium sp.]